MSGWLQRCCLPDGLPGREGGGGGAGDAVAGPNETPAKTRVFGVARTDDGAAQRLGSVRVPLLLGSAGLVFGSALVRRWRWRRYTGPPRATPHHLYKALGAWWGPKAAKGFKRFKMHIMNETSEHA